MAYPFEAGIPLAPNIWVSTPMLKAWKTVVMSRLSSPELSILAPLTSAEICAPPLPARMSACNPFGITIRALVSPCTMDCRPCSMLSACRATCALGVELTIRISCRDSSVLSPSYTATGRSCTVPFQNINTYSTAIATGMIMAAVTSIRLCPNRLISRFMLLLNSPMSCRSFC